MFYDIYGNVYESMEVWWHTKWHGRKRKALRYKGYNYETGDFVWVKISKSWKDQSKRKHQYKPYDL